MRIRHQLLIMVLICALGGVASTFSLSQLYRKLDIQQHQVGDNSPVLNDMERLRDGVDRLLVTTDLAIGGKETYLLAGAQKQVDQLLALTEGLFGTALLAQSRVGLETISARLDRFSEHIEHAARLSEEESHDLWNRLIESYDADTMVMVQTVEAVIEAAAQRSLSARKALEESRRSVHRLAWGCNILYVVLVVAVWQWSRSNVVKPLQSLTHAAHRAMSEDQHFVFSDTGPWETRQLARTIGEFVTTLETKVAKRTEELENQTRLLNQEIVEREKVQKEKEQTEAVLRQSQKMEAIGTLAGGIAHDFNNILFAILGYARLARKNAGEGTPTEKHVGQIVVAANRAKDLVGQILTFSRKSDQPPQVIDAADIVEETLSLMRSSLPKTIEIVKVMEAHDSTILADATRIHQVLMNLCTNAGHAMAGETGVLEVGMTDADIDTPLTFRDKRLEPGSYVMISIRDNGCGMDETLMERIFEPFFTTKEVGKGTGLGLAMVHGIVEEYGGLITVESEVGVGTCFHIFFPKVERQGAKATSASETLQGHGETIMIVDDEALLVDMMVQSLRGMGYQVVGKTDSREALETFRAASQKFDLILTDQTMPGMTGLQLAKAVLGIRPDVPVLLCTGFTKEALGPQVRALGITDIIYKPVNVEDVARKIRKLLDARRAMV